MNPALREPDPVPPPPSVPRNLQALTLLLYVFHEMSDEPVTDPREFAREVELRWGLWRDVEGWNLPSQLLGGHWELHLRQRILNVRFFRGEASVVRMRILLDSEDGLLGSIMDFGEDPDAGLIGARLLELVSYSAILKPLERSLVEGLRRRLSVDDLARELE